jgi:hypothetical protein
LGPAAIRDHTDLVVFLLPTQIPGPIQPAAQEGQFRSCGLLFIKSLKVIRRLPVVLNAALQIVSFPGSGQRWNG